MLYLAKQFFASIQQGQIQYLNSPTFLLDSTNHKCPAIGPKVSNPQTYRAILIIIETTLKPIGLNWATWNYSS